jgi:hypothetical protein
MKSKEENEISTPFRKRTKVELVFHFFPIVFQFVPFVSSMVTEYFQIKVSKICPFSRD